MSALAEGGDMTTLVREHNEPWMRVYFLQRWQRAVARQEKIERARREKLYRELIEWENATCKR